MRILVVSMAFIVASSFSAFAVVVKLPNSTVVVVTTTSELTPARNPIGSTVTLSVAQNVAINGRTVIAAGAPVIGIVETAETEGMVGQAGKITISFQTVTAVDGTNVGLTGSFRNVGEDEMGGTVAIGLVLCPLALLNKGGVATVASGAQARAITNGDYQIDVPGV